MGQSSNRIIVVDAVDQEGEPIPGAIDEFMRRMGAVLQEVGGTLVVEAQRVKVAELGGEPIGMTVQVVAKWDSYSQLAKLDEGDDVMEPVE
jgi:hypothetical protein